MQKKDVQQISSPITLATSRYYKSKAYLFQDSKVSTLETYKRTKTPSTSSDRYAVVSGRYKYRPDLLSEEAYGVPDLWWLIMEANGIRDIADFVPGLNVRLPGTITSMVRS